MINKIKIFLSILILFLFSCKRKEDNFVVKSIENKDKTFNLFYTINKENSLTYLDSIIIINKKDNKNVQKILLDSNYYLLSENEIDFNIDTDINFDGFTDISLVNNVEQYNQCFSFWIYNKEQRKFLKENIFDTIYNISINSTKKEIYSKYRIGLQNFYFDKYIWLNNKLILIEKYEENWRNDSIGNLNVSMLDKGKFISRDTIIRERIIEKMQD